MLMSLNSRRLPLMRLKNTQFWCVAMVMALFLRVCLAQNQGQGQGQPQPAFNGTVVSAAANGRSFVIVDKNGAMATIEVTPATTYLLNKANASFVEVARFGMNVRGTLAPDGSVAQVTGRGIAAQMNVSQMQAFLGVNDEEWAILKPRIERVQSLRRIAESRATSIDNGGGNNNGNAPAERNPVQELQKSLNKAFFDPGTTNEKFKESLVTLRDTQAKARAELAKARQDLVELTTTRQEVLLVIMGILE
jgi:hypothetical protein